MDDLESFSVKDSDFEFLNDKYWLIRSLYAERGITLPVEPLASDEEEDFFKNLSLNGQNGVNGHNGQNGHKSNGVANGRSEVLERLEELEALQRMERTELDVKKSSLSLPMPGTVVRPRPTLSRAMLNKLNDIDTRTFTRAKRSPVHPNRTFGNHFEHNISEDLLNISEADIEADMNRIMGSSLFSSDAFALDSPLKNNQSFIITKANDISTDMLNVTPDPNQHANELMNATFTNNIDNGISPGFANNYDDVQEIARKQEEALRKKSNLLRNNTIIKTRRERVAGDLDTTIVMDKEGSEASDKVDFNSTFSKAELQPCLISPETMLSLDSPDKTERLTSRRSFVICKTSTVTKKSSALNGISGELSDSTPTLNLLEDASSESEFKVNAQASPQVHGRLSRAFSAGAVGTQTITKGFKNSTVLKRTKTFKVREYQSISEENLNMTLNKELKVFNGNETFNGNTSINKAESGEIFKQPPVTLQKKYSKSNISLQESFTPLKENALSNTSIKKSATKIPSFTSRLRAPEQTVLRSQLAPKSVNTSFKMSAKVETQN